MKFKTILKAGLLIITGFLIAIVCIAPLRSQIQSIAGLAVAQTPLRWNNVKDGAAGDNLTNGLLAAGLYGYDGTNWDRVRIDGSGSLNVNVATGSNMPVYTTISASFTHNQVNVTNAATIIIAANANRRSVIIRNHSTATDMYIGGAAVTIANGLLLNGGEALTLDRNTAVVYGICAVAGPTVAGYLEE